MEGDHVAPLKEILRPVIGATLVSQIEIGRAQKGRLTLIAVSSVTADRLMPLIPSMQEALHQAGIRSIKEIRIAYRNAAKALTLKKADRMVPLDHLMGRAQKAQSLKKKVEGLLGETYRGHFNVGDPEGDRLVLLAESSIWANRLRYESPRLLAFLRKNGMAELRHVETRVQRGAIPTAEPAQPAKREVNPMSEESAHALQTAADYVGDEKLAAALRRLASRGQKKKG